jgi:Holliday junction resolvase RusA-like endonuclease
MFQVSMPYIGGVLSDNNYKLPTRGTKWVVKKWMLELEEKTRGLEVPVADGYKIGVRGLFSDERRPDISNLFKVIADAVKRGLGVDDKHFRMMDLGYTTGHLEPELIITIEVADATNS